MSHNSIPVIFSYLCFFFFTETFNVARTFLQPFNPKELLSDKSPPGSRTLLVLRDKSHPGTQAFLKSQA